MEWKPTPVQELALSTTADEVLFGGSRGGGKTDTALQWLLYDIDNPKLRQLVIRRNATDLSDFIDRARTKYKPIGATISGNPTTITFPSGAIIYTGHLATPDAYTKYQGWEIHRLLVEEATHIPSVKQYEQLLGSLRSTVEGIKTQVFLTTNPGGVGHEWVKDRFEIGNKENSKKFFKTITINKIEYKRSFIYIPATIYDNPHLMEKDPSYLAYLHSLPETLKEQWLNGKWDDFDIEGAYYVKQINQASNDGRITSIPVESTLKTYTFWDLGIADSTAIWVIQAHSKELRVIAYYENNGEGLTHYINWLHDLRDKFGITYSGHFAPHDIQVRELTSGKSRLETARALGISFRVVKNKSIMDGIEQGRNIISRCWFDAERCKDGLKALKNYRKEFDEKRNTWKDNPLHDWTSHGSDAWRMFAVAWNDNFATGHRQETIIPKQDWSVF